MNNMSFNKNPFNNQEQAKIASKVIINNNVGRVSVDEIRSNMNNLRQAQDNVQNSDTVPTPTTINNNQNNNMSEITRMRMQALKNIGKK